MSTEIVILYPSGRAAPNVGNELSKHARDDVNLTLDSPSEALPESGGIDSQYRYLKSANAVTEYIIHAEEQGYDGVVVACQSEPGVSEARSAVNIPVIGTLRASCQIATQMGGRFSVIGDRQMSAITETKRIEDMGFRETLASYRPVNLTTEQFETEPKSEVRDRIFDVMRRCVVDDYAEVIVSGCTLLLDVLGDDTTVSCAELGVPIADGQDVEVPIILPTVAGLKLCEVMIEMTHSVGYPAPVSRVGQYRDTPGDNDEWRQWLHSNVTPEAAYVTPEPDRPADDNENQ